MPNPTKRAAQVKARYIRSNVLAHSIPSGEAVFVLPADPASLERMREQVDCAIANGGDWSFGKQPSTKQLTKAVLSSLGLTTGGRK